MSHFNDIANEWDSNSKIDMMKNLAAKTMQYLKLQHKVDILDFGCGTGLFGLEFEDYIKTLTGIDTSEGMLSVFNEKTKDHPYIKSLAINLEKENISDKFDLIISSMAFHHLHDPLTILIKLKNCLNPGGKIVIVDLDQEDGSFHPDNNAMGVHHFGFSAKEITLWATKSEQKLEYTTIDTITKNNKEYKQFLAVFSAS